MRVEGAYPFYKTATCNKSQGHAARLSKQNLFFDARVATEKRLLNCTLKLRRRSRCQRPALRSNTSATSESLLSDFHILLQRRASCTRSSRTCNHEDEIEKQIQKIDGSPNFSNWIIFSR
ncbi:unnamed protein product [Amoebophrya sp. A120]|nr:unnamed protein product [Amoebophrya sp. A120]|eukprot:GSA120T00017126001.1